MVRRSPLLVIAAVVAAATLVGCSSSGAGPGSPSASVVAGSPSAATTPTTPAPTSVPAPRTTSHSPHPAHSTPVHSTSTHASTPQCTSDIRVIPQGGQGAAGHLSLVLVFNNVSTTKTCELFGYPGVDEVTSSGATVVHLTRTLRGMAGGEPAGVTAPQPVILAPGASASALAEASDVPQGGITDCGSYPLLITVPNQFVSVSGGTAMLPKCDAQIHPVVPGTTGGMN